MKVFPAGKTAMRSSKNIFYFGAFRRASFALGSAAMLILLCVGSARADYVACLQACVAQYYACTGGGFPGLGPLGNCVYELGECKKKCHPDPPPPGPPCDKCPAQQGDPVSCSSGLFVYDNTDLSLKDVIPIELKRTYREVDASSQAFGIGWSHNYDIFLFVDESGQYTYADLILPDAGRVHYVRTSPGTDFYSAVFEHTSSPTEYFGSKVHWDGTNWVLTMKDGTVMIFGTASMLVAIQDRNGNLLAINRDANNRVSTVESPNGRWISFTYDSSNRITQVQDNIGRSVGYAYDSGGHLSQFTDAAGGVTRYGYDGGGLLATITTPRGNVMVTNQYDANGRVIQQTHADNGTFAFSYTLDGGGNLTASQSTDPNGTINQFNFSSGYLVGETKAVGRPEQQTHFTNRDPSTNLIQSELDALGRTTSYTYDALGNITSVTRLAGTSTPVTTSYTYDPTFSQVTGITDPLGHTWTFERDSHGNMVSITDPLSHQTTFSYNAQGQPLSVTDAVGDPPVRFAYQNGLLSSIADPLGNVTSIFTDGAGRKTDVRDPLGNTTSYAYSPLDKMAAIGDPLGGLTSFAYDADANLTSVTNTRGGTTTYTYDAMDRRASRTDPLRATETYDYDGNGNLIQRTDRRGKTTIYQYDGLNRRTFAGYGRSGNAYESTINYVWDAGNRMTQAVDSIAGTIARAHDGLDDLVDEQTPQGEISYSYDLARRRQSMTVVGQQPVGYSWDNANRLLAITQGSATVGFTYDATNRRSSLTLPNGIVLAYSFDDDSRITGMTWTLNGNPVGDLEYAYDAAGRVIQRSGSLAQTNLPQPVVSNTFNAANEMLTFNGAVESYDANGNLTSDATNTYTWDARNHLVGVGGGVTASFLYDALGRRAAKTINGTTTLFLYDGFNAVQELDGSSNVTAITLTGLGIDEYFQRTDTAGPRSFLRDLLGSSLALSDPAGTIQTRYLYEPFGGVIVAGGTNTNPYQFTGRENDGTGLYYYRARYFSPAFQRFTSQSPIGLTASANLYAYVSNAPTNFADPRGIQLDASTGTPDPTTPSPSPSPTPSPGEPPTLPRWVRCLAHGGCACIGEAGCVVLCGVEGIEAENPEITITCHTACALEVDVFCQQHYPCGE